MYKKYKNIKIGRKKERKNKMQKIKIKYKKEKKNLLEKKLNKKFDNLQKNHRSERKNIIFENQKISKIFFLQKKCYSLSFANQGVFNQSSTRALQPSLILESRGGSPEHHKVQTEILMSNIE